MAEKVETTYIPGDGEWIDVTPDTPNGTGNEAVMGLLGMLSRVEASGAGMHPGMRAIVGNAFKNAGICGIAVYVDHGKGDDFTVRSLVMRNPETGEVESVEAVPCAGE